MSGYGISYTDKAGRRDLNALRLGRTIPELAGLTGRERLEETRRLNSRPVDEPELFPGDEPGAPITSLAPVDLEKEYEPEGPPISGALYRTPAPKRTRVRVEAAAPVSVVPAGRRTCPRGCGRTFRAKGTGYDWHVQSWPDCAK